MPNLEIKVTLYTTLSGQPILCRRKTVDEERYAEFTTECLDQFQGTVGNDFNGRKDGTGRWCTILSYLQWNCEFVDVRWNLAQISSPGKITDAFSSLAKRSNFRAISKKLNLVCGTRLDGKHFLLVS